jgi:hypothetical protein
MKMVAHTMAVDWEFWKSKGTKGKETLGKIVDRAHSQHTSWTFWWRDASQTLKRCTEDRSETFYKSKAERLRILVDVYLTPIGNDHAFYHDLMANPRNHLTLLKERYGLN